MFESEYWETQEETDKFYKKYKREKMRGDDDRIYDGNTGLSPDGLRDSDRYED